MLYTTHDILYMHVYKSEQNFIYDGGNIRETR